MIDLASITSRTIWVTLDVFKGERMCGNSVWPTEENVEEGRIS